MLNKKEIEEVIKIYRKVLEDESFNIGDDFFEKGGNSLSAAKICKRIKNESDIAITIADVLQNPTIEGLSKVLDSKKVMDKENKIIPKICPKKRYDTFPLTKIQKAYLLGRKSSSWASHYYLELKRKELDKEKLEKIINVLIKEHDALRIVIEADENSQRVLKDVLDYKVEFNDLSVNEDTTLFKDIRSQMENQILDVHTWPLFDIKVTKKKTDEYILHFSFDNVILDGFSILSILKEIAYRYENDDFLIKDQEVLFRDYAISCDLLNQSDIYKKSKEFWHEKIKSMALAPAIPTIEKKKYGGFYRLFGCLKKDKWERLKKLAAKNKVTANAVLLTAFCEVLYRWNFNKSFTLNLTVYNKDIFEEPFKNVLGDFTAVSLLMVTMGEKLTFIEKCQKIQRELSCVLENRYYDGVEVQRDYIKNNNLADKVPFPIVFTSTLGVLSESKLPGERYYGITQTPNVWFDHQIWEVDEELLYNWDILEGKYKKEMIQDMFCAYENILEELSKDFSVWEKSQKSIVKIQDKEIRNAGLMVSEELKGHSLVEIVLNNYENKKDNVAVIFDNKKYSYKELLKLAFTLKNKLCQEALFGILMEKGINQIVAVLAVLLNKSAYVPIDIKNPKERIEKIVNSSGIKTLITDDIIPKKADENIDIEKEIEEILKTDFSEKLAYIIYTSGSTGQPKGVMISHKSAANTILDINNRLGLSFFTCGLAISNLSFDLSVFDIFGILAAGGRIVIPKEDEVKDPEKWIKFVEENQISLWNSVPQFMEMLLLYIEKNHKSYNILSSLKFVLLSGDKIEKTLPKRIRNVNPFTRVICMGGATEASIWSNIYECYESEEEWNSIPYGYPLTNQKYYVLNKELLECPDFVTGELYIAGEGLALSYANDKEMTEKKFIFSNELGERIYKTGDLGRYDNKGRLIFVGRDDRQVKLQGYRIETGEVEAAFLNINGVSSVKVILHNCELWAFVILKVSENTDYLRQKLKEKLPNYYIPKHIVEIEEFPVSINGKIDEKSLGLMCENLKSKEVVNEFLQTDTEKNIADIWKKHLNKQTFSLEDDFFLCGGNSLSAIETMADIKEKYKDLDIGISDLYENSTIMEFSKLIDSRKEKISAVDSFVVGVI
ncbi:yersiniabactin nonribosomal peptide synthetase [Acetitomaculum ruminis DSM 5522]|uniref:Yersiniabactin nonribosomal peptide synthetase n=1 Tax=Acetitomaculum ruminis DSM 5522 TaxID=1120918 RepID=A0A1I0XAB6_9FIRM|nr:non-ribosomal peptide synthetase [Acetitomaculum ruminis]SFA97238.1 yersiniabactin nonribosomal peptide synthetase [Acetitomaculum ruminis DSM 5522]